MLQGFRGNGQIVFKIKRGKKGNCWMRIEETETKLTINGKENLKKDK